MNFHVLQTQEARAEAEHLMAVRHNIVTPQSHRPVMSFVMDSFLGACEFTEQDTFLTKEEIMAWGMEIEQYELPLPAILKPERWTGKQAISMLMPKTMQYNVVKPTIDEKINDVVIQNGQMLYGQFGKSVLGRSQGSLVHVFFNDFGPTKTVQFINKMQLGIHRWFSEQGFSIGIKDCICHAETQALIQHEYDQTLEETKQLTNEDQINGRLNRARDGMGRAALSSISKANRLFRMVSCGVKGSMMNILQIMAMVGQQNSSGKRMQTTIGDKTLPCFEPNDTSPMSKGMVRSPYLKGLNPAEFFFSAIVGRDGCIDTAINTAVTGYIQRRMVKALESCKTQWDGSVRDAGGSIIQFKYGEDGFDGQKLEMNTNLLDQVEEYDWGNDTEMAWILEAKQILTTSFGKQYTKPTCFNVLRQIKRISNSTRTPTCLPHEIFAVTYEPLTRLYHQNKFAWATVLQSMAAKRAAVFHCLTPAEALQLMEFFETRYHQSMVPAGEMVGTLAAQSLGEPVTQMTLNMFHHAGDSTKNVSLGVPRFEELINASKSPRTPTCSIMFGEHGPAEIDRAVDVAFRVVRTVVRDVVSDASIRKINIAQEHPLYVLLPDHVLKKLEDDGNWSLRILISKQLLIQRQLEFSVVVQCIMRCISKTMNVAYTENPLGDSIIDVSGYGKKNTPEACRQIRNKIMNVVINGIENIQRAYVCIENGQLSVETIGTNIGELNTLKNMYPSIQTVLSNDPFDVKSVFGIEAARNTLYQQIHMVLSFDGSYVNSRHYQILVDWMTHSGDITATTRHGIAKYNDMSPLARATFEQPIEVLLDACEKRKSDPLDGISEQLLLGISPKIGTEMFDVVETEEYKSIRATAEESSDEEDGWLGLDNEIVNPFKPPTPPAPPMLQPFTAMHNPMWSQPAMPMTTPGWCQDPFTVNNTWENNNPFNVHEQAYVAPSFSQFGQPGPVHSPTSPAYDPNGAYSPTSPAYNPGGAYSPTSPAYDPNGAYSPTSPAYDPNGAYSPTSPAYNPNGAYSPASPAYDPNGAYSPASPAYNPN